MKKEIKLTKTESPLLIKANGFFFALFGRPRAEREMNLSAETFSAERFIFTTALQAKNFLSQVRDDDAPSKNSWRERDGRGLIVSQYRRINTSVLRDYRLMQLTKSIIVKLTSLKSLCHNNSFVVDKSKIIIQ